jgi:hypothetical protein
VTVRAERDTYTITKHDPPMKPLRAVFAVAALVAPLVGCETIKGWTGKDKSKHTDAVKPVAPEQLVTYINERAGRFQSITNADVRLSAKMGGVPVPMRGTLCAAQPRYFRLDATSGVAGVKVDLGSNPDLFWVYAKVPTQDPMFVYASHQAFESGRARLPGDIPFEPDWVMQALGMTVLPLSDKGVDVPGVGPPGAAPPSPKSQYSVRIDEKARTYTLSWPSALPSGESVVKEIVFDADTAPDPKPQVRRHVVKDTKGRVICYAEVKAAKTVRTGGTDPVSGLPLAFQYPTHVVLKWEEQKFEMDLEIKNAQINKPITPEEYRLLFNRPEKADARPIDLAVYNTFPPK